jgi:dinuclear metal center YbgI/SA1388 family protein
MKLSEIIRILEDIAPPEYAQADDSIGLQIGDPNQDVRRVMVTVDVTPGVVAEAIRRPIDLLVSHHPLLSVKYSPLASVRLDQYPQSLVYQLVNGGVGLWVMHTNFDAAVGGINDVLAERLGIVDTQVFLPTRDGKMFKVMTFVPGEAVDAVRDAISEAGGGVIGNYTQCSFQSPGTGTFKPEPGAEPCVGKVGKLEKAAEFRLEMLVPEHRLHDAISALIAAHPYDEVAYDVYPLWNKGETHGIGRIGKLREPMSFQRFCAMVCRELGVPDPRVVGDPESMAETIAFIGGGGGSRVGMAHEMGADVYLTGDVNHHQFLEAKALGINVIDATHFWTERPGMIALAPRLHELLSPKKVTVEYWDDFTLSE